MAQILSTIMILLFDCWLCLVIPQPSPVNVSYYLYYDCFLALCIMYNRFVFQYSVHKTCR